MSSSTSQRSNGGGRRIAISAGAVQRTKNFGVTTEVVDEQGLNDALLAELTDVILASGKRCPLRARVLDVPRRCAGGQVSGVSLIIARDKNGRVQGFHRYATAGEGTEVTLDVPWRRRGAPNGIDERLSVDMVANVRVQGRNGGCHSRSRLSPRFSPTRTAMGAAQPRLHRGAPRRPADHSNSLYRYLRKFHALGERRYVMATLTGVGAVAHRVVVPRIHGEATTSDYGVGGAGVVIVTLN